MLWLRARTIKLFRGIAGRLVQPTGAPLPLADLRSRLRTFPPCPFRMQRPRHGSLLGRQRPPEEILGRTQTKGFGCELRLGHTDHADRDAVAGIARRLALQVVFLGVNDHTAAEDGAGAFKGKDFGSDVDLGGAAGVGLDIAEVAAVMMFAIGCAVGFAGGIKVAAGGFAVLGRGVAEFVNVEAVLACGEARHFAFDVHSVCSLGEGDGTGDFTPLRGDENRDGFGGFGGLLRKSDRAEE